MKIQKPMVSKCIAHLVGTVNSGDVSQFDNLASLIAYNLVFSQR